MNIIKDIYIPDTGRKKSRITFFAPVKNSIQAHLYLKQSHSKVIVGDQLLLSFK